MLVGYYHMSKKIGIAVNTVAAVYLTFASIFFFFPTALPVTGDNMNYAIVAFGIVTILGSVCWFGGGKKTYGELIERAHETISVGPDKYEPYV